MNDATQKLRLHDPNNDPVRGEDLGRSVSVGDVVVSLITATVFGLTRAIDSLDSRHDRHGEGRPPR
jgi:hypothetical protein